MKIILKKRKLSRRFFLVRGRKVIIDSDLARIYGVTTRRLNEQVRRNIDRFPGDFMFELTKEENVILMSQNATSRLESNEYNGKKKMRSPPTNTNWGGRRKITSRLYRIWGIDACHNSE